MLVQKREVDPQQQATKSRYIVKLTLFYILMQHYFQYELLVSGKNFHGVLVTGPQ